MLFVVLNAVLNAMISLGSDQVTPGHEAMSLMAGAPRTVGPSTLSTVPGVSSPAPRGLLTVGILIAFLVIVGLASTWWIRRRGRFGSPANQATYLTLHAASQAARHLRDGLTKKAAARAARDLRPLLGVSAIALCDPDEVLAWEGQGHHHQVQVRDHAEQVLATGRTVRLGERELGCANLDCPIRNAILAPVICEDKVVAALGSYNTTASADLARATEAVAGWIATQVDLAELSRQRSRLAEAELRALRAQISPHFIYNSLAAIASYIRTDPVRARELLLEFADFTRYSLRRAGPYATLSEELGNVERYLALEQARFGDRLQVTLLVAPEVLPVSIPTLTIQPLVENAVQHGIESKDGVGHISIVASNLGPDAEIVIEDDGAGANPDDIRELLSGRQSGDHLGLGNVDARLRQTYGDDYGLVVETAEGAGMRITFRVPKFSPKLHG